MPVIFSPAQNSPTVRAEQYPSLSERLQKYRLENGLTLQKLGYLCGVNHITIARACRGCKLTERIASKIDRFLRSADAPERELLDSAKGVIQLLHNVDDMYGSETSEWILQSPSVKALKDAIARAEKRA